MSDRPANKDDDPTKTCPYCHGTGFVRLDVEPGHPLFGKAVPCKCKRQEIRKKRLASLRRTSNLDQLQRMTFETFRIETVEASEASLHLQFVLETCKNYSHDPSGWLLLSGTHGCGKTHLAAAIANDRLSKALPVIFETVPDLLDHLRGSYAPNSPVSYDEHFDMLRTIEMLILDDFGTQNATPWASEKLYQLLNYRYNAELPTVITTNQAISEMEPRLASRLGDRHLVRSLDFYLPDYRMDGLTRTFGSLSPYQGMTFSTFSHRDIPLLKRLRNQAAGYSENPVNWLILRGDYGVGKTHLAAAVANKIQRGGMRVLFVVVPDLLDYLRATFQPGSSVSYDRRFSDVRQAPFLVLDDMGMYNATDWAREKLFQILNHRYVQGLATVITISTAGWERIDSRLRGRLENNDRCAHLLLDVPSYEGRASSSHKPRRTTRRRT